MAVKCILTGQTPSVLDGVTENVQTQLNDKVDKVTGKGLSTNDYTGAEKTKLSGIETGAQKNTITGVKGNAETTYRTGNVNITATNIGLGNVNNTSDAEKPISTATKTALDGKQAKVTGAASTITGSNLTANRALLSNSSGKVAVSSITSTELGYLDGVTSNIQTQLNSKLSSAPVTSVNKKTGAVSLGAKDVGAQPTISANGILKGDGSGNITAANEIEVELVSLPNICNPNLLDNWYFGNPVDQRNGYLVYEGANLYSDATCTTVVGNVSGGPYQAYPISSICVSFTTNATYYCKIGDAGVVRGYVEIGYTIDRWKLQNASGSIVLDDTGIMFTAKATYAEFEQQYEFPRNISGKQITVSILVDSFSGEGDFYLVIQNQTKEQYQTFHLSVGLNSFTLNFFNESSKLRFFIQGQNVNNTANPPKMHFLAAKLELGSQQTLCHQENGKWVLNEIPDYGEQLRRCQRYFFKLNNRPMAGGWVYNEQYANVLVNTPVTMRALPSIKSTVSIGILNTVAGLRQISRCAPITVEANGISVDMIATNNDFPTSFTPVYWSGGGGVEFSADL